MAKKNDDIFRKLKKETPLVKRRDLQPLSSRDFTPKKSAFDIQIEKNEKKKRVSQPPRSSQGLSLFADSNKRPVYRKSKTNSGAALASRYNSAKKTPPKREFDIMGQSVPEKAVKPAPKKTIRQPEKPLKQEIFAEKAKNKAKADHAEKPSRLTQKAKAESKSRETEIMYSPQKKAAVMSAGHRDALSSEVSTAGEKALQFRHELKYYINYRDYVLLRSALKALMPLDAYAGEDGTYHIRSLYFDDVYETAVKEKMAGTDGRSKYRVRIYNFSDDVIKFEKKIKRGQYVAKKSITLSRTEYESIAAGDYGFLLARQEPLAQELYVEMRSNLLRPRVFVDYVREAYVSPLENVRITFDKDLKSGLALGDIFDAHTPVMSMYDEGMMVLEVKFNRYLPEFIKCVLNNINTAQRSAISKYIICRKYD